VTFSIVVLNILVFLYELYLLFTGGEEALNHFVTTFGVVPAALTQGQSILIPFYLTPLTMMFVHGSVSHVGFNMVYLSAFGDNVEDRLRLGGYIVFYLVSGLLATFAQVFVDPTSQIPSVGASGAIAGVLAGYVILFPGGHVRALLFWGPFIRIARVSALLFIGFWFITQFFAGVASLGVPTAETGGIAYWAHIGGFLAGAILALLYKQFSRKRENES